MRTRLRRLRLGPRIFTWCAEIHHLQGSADCHRCVRVRAWGSGKTGQALQADLMSTFLGPWGACTTDGSYPTSGAVRGLVTYGLRHGWQPERRGGVFALTEARHAGTLPLTGFLLTDRLRTPHGADPSERLFAAFQLRQDT
ncbi:integrase [Actinoplanes oblitus]|uniref:Integrase n=1 Tax=Actinoplanes oblitus TaxID=3040509 RepID=A0ABY8WCV0_9ACTN|nr:integrase [Actinoplanes oblitus]WIM93540.1 integrase [Actinoplanes oblitus]